MQTEGTGQKLTAVVVGHAFSNFVDTLECLIGSCPKFSSWNREHCHDTEESIVGGPKQCRPSQHVEKHLTSEQKISRHELVHIFLVVCVRFATYSTCFFAIFFDVVIISEFRHFQFAITIWLQEMLLQRSAALVWHKHHDIMIELSHGHFALAFFIRSSRWRRDACC